MMGTTSSTIVQSLGKIEQRAPAVGAKIWCLSLCIFCLSRSKAGAQFVRGRHSSNRHCVAVYFPISTRFQRFFRRGLLFEMHYIVLIFVARWRHNFREIAVKNYTKSPKIAGSKMWDGKQVEPLKGSLEAELPAGFRVSRQPVKLPEAESFLALVHPQEWEN